MRHDSVLERLRGIAVRLSPAALASSLSAEDMVLTDLIARNGLPIEIFILDTGRLHADTLDLLDEIASRYGLHPTVYSPDAAALAEYVSAHGRDAFYESVDLRRECCRIRKVEPLARALSGKRAWLTGQRRAQSAGRLELPEREFDAVHGLDKFNPLAAWSDDEVWRYIRELRVPYNRLYEQGYRSIGCAPCTRPVLPGEPLRAGRWWWEPAEAKECGLHLDGFGRLARAKQPA